MRLILLAFIFTLSGCQVATKVSEKRDQIAITETELHLEGLCSSNFDVLYSKFGSSDELWSAFLTICQHKGSSTLREPK